MPQLADIIVIGGGVIGCSVAYHLGAAGYRCTLIERDTIGAGASGVAAGMLTVTFDHLDPSGGKPGGGPDPVFELGLESLKLYPETLKALHEASGIDPEYITAGTLRLACTEREERDLRDAIPRLRPHLEVDWVPGDDVLKTEPLLNPSIRGALFTPGERQVRAARLTQAYAQAAASTGRVSFLLGSPVAALTCQGQRATGVRFPDGSHLSADHVVLAAGAWSGFVSESVGISVPVRPVRGQIISLYLVPRPLRMCVLTSRGYLTPKVDGTVLLGATCEEAGFDCRPTAGGIGGLLASLPEMAPGLASSELRELRAGLRPGTPDDAPVLGPVPGWEGITVATGHFRSGILLSAITGRLIRDSITTGKTDVSLEPFSPARFD